MTPPFSIGDHTFDDSGKPASLSPMQQKDKRPIAGAQAPPFLAGCVREPAISAAAKVLVQGTFCGHGEPAFTVFDVVIDGRDRLDVVTFFEDDGEEREDDDEGQEAAAVLVRPVGTKGPWLVVYSVEWQTDDGDLQPPAEPEWQEFDEEDEADMVETAQPALVSIGFEYPPDASALDDFTWLAIDAWPDDHEGDPYVLVSDETR